MHDQSLYRLAPIPRFTVLYERRVPPSPPLVLSPLVVLRDHSERGFRQAAEWRAKLGQRERLRDEATPRRRDKLRGLVGATIGSRNVGEGFMPSRDPAVPDARGRG